MCRGAEDARAALKAHLRRWESPVGMPQSSPTAPSAYTRPSLSVRWLASSSPPWTIRDGSRVRPRARTKQLSEQGDHSGHNGRTDAETLGLYERWKASGAVELVSFDRPSTDLAVRNAGAAVASGYLVFLENDLQFVSPDWLEELLRWAQRPDVGIVGPKVVNPSGAVKHAGIAVTLDSYVNVNQNEGEARWGILGHVDSYKNVSGLEAPVTRCHARRTPG